jgi:hypothetical protein
VAQEDLTVLDAYVRVDEDAPFDQLDDPIHTSRVAERPGKEIAEAGGHWQERHRTSHGRCCSSALGPVAAHADQQGASGGAGRRPAAQVLEPGEDLEGHVLAAGPKRLAELDGRGHGATVAGPGRGDDLDESSWAHRFPASCPDCSCRPSCARSHRLDGLADAKVIRRPPAGNARDHAGRYSKSAAS